MERVFLLHITLHLNLVEHSTQLIIMENTSAHRHLHKIIHLDMYGFVYWDLPKFANKNEVN